MSHSNGKQPEPVLNTLHEVVLDYLNSQAYPSTARALSIPRPWKHSDHSHGISGESSGSGGQASGSHIVNTAEEEEGSGDVEMDMEASVMMVDPKDEGEEELGSGIASMLSEKNLIAMERRRAIIDYILNGAIMRAIESLNNYFPGVLNDPSEIDESLVNSTPSNGQQHKNGKDNTISSSAKEWTYTTSSTSSYPYPARPNTSSIPTLNIAPPPPPLSPSHSLPTLPFSLKSSHVRLNLQIQSFIESFRQLAPPSLPSSPSSSIGSLTSTSSSSIIQLPMASSLTLTNALTAAQGLHQEAKRLEAGERALYLQEIKDVGALFAYTEPETSILRGFLEQGRRIALAQQVNRAILHSQSRPTHSKLESTARRVSALWSIMAEKKIDPIPNWTSIDGPGKDELALYLRNHPKRNFNLKDFVGHSTI